MPGKRRVAPSGWHSEFPPLLRSFFDRQTLTVAHDLLGKHLVRLLPRDAALVGRIVETEAYTGDDPAFHAWGIVDAPTGLVKPNGRGHDLFAAPGTAYVYLCYGKYWMLNVVTEREGVAGCVLIRAVESIVGHTAFYKNRTNVTRDEQLCDGPGKLTMAFGIDKTFHLTDLTGSDLYLADGPIPEERIAQSSRIGISRAVDLKWRFFLQNNRFVSKGVPSDVATQRRRKAR